MQSKYTKYVEKAIENCSLFTLSIIISSIVQSNLTKKKTTCSSPDKLEDLMIEDWKNKISKIYLVCVEYQFWRAFGQNSQPWSLKN